MQVLVEKEYQDMIAGAELQTEDAFGPKVYRLGDGRFLKLFRTKRLLSFANWYPYAMRFYDNSIKLSSKAILTVHCIETYRIPSIKRTAVLYQPLDGIALREIDSESFPVEAFARYFAKLHDKGIYFRSCHLANILKVTDDDFGLIDISDLYISDKPLSIKKRARNFQHLMRYDQDVNKLQLKQNTQFWDAYGAAAQINERELNLLKQRVIELC